MKVNNICISVILSLIIFSCSNDDIFFLDGIKYLENKNFEMAKLEFVKAYDYYKSKDDAFKCKKMKYYIIKTDLDSGVFINQRNELESLELSLTDEEKKEFFLLTNIKIEKIRANFYELFFKNSISEIEKIEESIDNQIKIIETNKKKKKDNNSEISLLIEKFVLYKSIYYVYKKNYQQYNNTIIKYSAYLKNDNLSFYNNLINKEPQKILNLYKSVINKKYETDMIWLLVNYVLFNDYFDTEQKYSIISEIKSIFQTNKSECLSIYIQYYYVELYNQKGIKEQDEINLIISKYKEVFPLLKGLLKEDLYINCISNLAIIYYNIGQYFEAKEYFNIALQYFEKTEFTENIAEIYNYIASIEKELGNISLSEKYFKTALFMFEKLNKAEKIASIYNNLSIIYKLQNDFIKSNYYIDQSINSIEKLLKDNTDDIKKISLIEQKLIKLNNKYEILISQKDYNNALINFNNLNQLLIENNFDNNEIKATINLNLARIKYNILLQNNNLTNSSEIDDIHKLLDFSRDYYYKNKKIIKISEIDYFKGLIYYNLNLFSDAEKYYQKSKETFEKSKNIYNLAKVSYSLYLLYANMNNEELALNHLEECVNNYDSYINLIPSMNNQLILFNEAIDKYYLLIDLLIKNNFYEKAFFYSEKMKARVLIQSMLMKEIDTFINIPEKYKTRLNELVIIESTLIKKFEENYSYAYLFNDYSYTDNIKKQLDLIKTEKDDIYREIRILNSHIADINEVKAVDLKTLQKILTNKEIILSYINTNDNFYVFLITNNSLNCIKLDDYQYNIIFTLPQYRNELQYHSLDPSENSKKLYKTLVQPIINIISNYEHLIIIPYEHLFYIPFEALINPRTNNYLIDEFNGYISYNISATVYNNLKSKKPRVYAKDYLGIGDPYYPDPYMRLHFTEKELVEVYNLFDKNKSDLFIKTDSTENNVKRIDLSQYKYLHFSCHGLNYGKSDTKYLSFPALCLIADENGTDDGYLKQDEISSLNCQSKLVLLSACQTGVGKVIKGDGLVGLNQAFFIAGADSIISSLWSVSDKYTKDLIVDFYKNLNLGMNYSVSLKKAMIETRRIAKNEQGQTHPFFWAPFIVMGLIE